MPLAHAQPPTCIVTFAGTGTRGNGVDGGVARQTNIDLPLRVAYDNSTGMVAWTEVSASAGRIRGVWPNGTITTLLTGATTRLVGLAFAPNGTLYYADSNL